MTYTPNTNNDRIDTTCYRTAHGTEPRPSRRGLWFFEQNGDYFDVNDTYANAARAAHKHFAAGIIRLGA